MKAIRMENLTKVYRVKRGFKSTELKALDGLTLDVEEGEVFGFLGPNGAGKSTTIKLLMNFLKPTGGEAWIMDIPVKSWKARKYVGYLPESPVFYDYLTAEEFLTYMGRLQGMGGSELRKRVKELLAWSGLEPFTKWHLRKFSKGMLQRLGLAQAIVNDPPIVILDEPTSGLDPLGRRLVLDLILNLKNKGKTVFFSTHILKDVEAVADRVGILVKGRLKRVGKMKSFLREEEGYNIIVEKKLTSLEPLLKVYTESIEDGIDGVILRIRGEDNFWKVMEILREKGISVLQIDRKRKTLEEVFIEEVSEVGIIGG